MLLHKRTKESVEINAEIEYKRYRATYKRLTRINYSKFVKNSGNAKNQKKCSNL